MTHSEEFVFVCSSWPPCQFVQVYLVAHHKRAAAYNNVGNDGPLQCDLMHARCNINYEYICSSYSRVVIFANA